MDSDVAGGSVGYHLHDLVVFGCNNPLSAPSQVVAGSPSHADRVCQDSNCFEG